MKTFDETMQENIKMIEKALHDYLSEEQNAGYDEIFESAKYSVEAGGKRIRPMLTLEFCKLCGGEKKDALAYAAALEMIHTYSLIHDDLPAMDNDDLRRGRPTNHKVYGEAMAILSGDGLLTRAFEIAAAESEKVDAKTALKCTGLLAKAAGMNGMIGGQVIDIKSEHQKISLEQLTRLQALKTGALIKVGAVLGCVVAGKDDAETIKRAETFGEKLGLAFQIRDDILDIEGNSETLGKTIGKDEKNEKSTFPSLLGLEKCHELVESLTEEAMKAIEPMGETAFLTELATKLTSRTN